MDWFSIAFIISIAAPIPGLWMVLIVKPGIKKKTGKRDERNRQRRADGCRIN